MRATYRLIGCALCIAGIGGAAATSLDTHDLGSSPQAMIDSAGSHDSGGGDAAGLSRDCPPVDNSGSSTGNSDSSHNRSSGGGASTPSSPHRPHLGWQSLLPGSIQ